MGKYEPLWRWISENGAEHFQLTFAQIAEIAGLPIDHSFLKYKKELLEYGYRVGKISMKAETVTFEKISIRFTECRKTLREGMYVSYGSN